MTSRHGRYRLYGLELQSRLRLPCPPSPRTGTPHVRLVPAARQAFARALRGTRVPNARDWFRCRQLPDGSMYLGWTGLFDFLVAPDGSRIRYRRLERASPESFSTYLLSQVLSFSLLAFGREPLHGTVVVVDGGAVAFLGDCGYGKSTLGAAMMARGFPVLTDDLVSLTPRGDGFTVHAGVPRIKLFPAVSRHLLGLRVGERMNPGTSKLVLPLGGRRVRRQAAPLRAIYVLSDPTLPVARISIKPLDPAAAMIETVRNTFNTIVVGPERMANQFRLASAVAGAVPVKRLAYPRRLQSLPALCDAIIADLAS